MNDFIGKIIAFFAKYSDVKLDLKATVIYNSMNLNPVFPLPDPDMPALNNAILEYREALLNAQSRDYNAVLIKNQKRASLIMLLESLAKYVTFTAKGDVVALGSSGYDLVKAPVPVTISAPQNVTITDGLNLGELTIKADAVKGSPSYVPQITTAPLTPDSVWISYPCTKRTFTFKNLLRGQLYFCRIGALGSKGQLVFSDAVSRVAQ